MIRPRLVRPKLVCITPLRARKPRPKRLIPQIVYAITTGPMAAEKPNNKIALHSADTLTICVRGQVGAYCGGVWRALQ